MSHGLDRDGWPSADTVLSTERNQLEVLLRCPGQEQFPHLMARERNLRDAIDALYEELAKRDPDEDYEVIVNVNVDKRSYRGY